MNTTKLICLPLLLSVVLTCGCDVVTGGRVSAERQAAKQQTATQRNEIEVLKDQNSQLTKMLEESESKLADRTSKLELVNQQLEELLAAKNELTARLAEANRQLVTVGEVAGQLEAAFKTNTENIEKQIQALGQMVPPTATDQHVEHDPTAEQTAETSDDHGGGH